MSLSRSAERVQSALDAIGLELQVRELPASTRTAEQAARAVGCQVGQIAKSLVFRAQQSGKAVMVIASGANRVDEARVAELLGEPVKMADPDFVRRTTGFAIGGVAPVGLQTSFPIFIDEDLKQYRQLWAAAGTPQAVFPIDPDSLVRATGGQVARIA